VILDQQVEIFGVKRIIAEDFGIYVIVVLKKNKK